MSQHEASRTLVKSPPELWAECSDASSLARHLDRFGEIRITKLEPETAVAWEGARGRGTVRLEPAGWGTKVVLTALVDEKKAPESVEDPDEVPEPVDVPEPVEVPEPVDVLGPVDVSDPASFPAAARRRRFARLRAFFRGPEPAEAPLATVTATVEPEPPPAEPSSPVADDTETALTAALDSLGQAHHRPFSRA